MKIAAVILSTCTFVWTNRGVETIQVFLIFKYAVSSGLHMYEIDRLVSWIYHITCSLSNLSDENIPSKVIIALYWNSFQGTGKLIETKPVANLSDEIKIWDTQHSPCAAM